MLIFLFCCIHYVQAVGHWSIDLQYSASDTDNFVSLGSITVDRTFDNNYTAHFQSSINPKKWRDDLVQAAKNGWIYRVRADSDNEHVQGYNEPCLMLQANGAHHFRIFLDPDRQNLQSLAVFPENLFVVGANYRFCDAKSFAEISKIRGSVVVNTVNELPQPDTVSYIRKMDMERQGRQQGNQQDNRSFLQKYSGMNSRQSDVVPSTSASTVAMENLKEQPISSGASAQKVSDVFLAAGQAFQKLGGLIANLHNPRSGVERKWTNSDTNSLHDAVSRFASDLQRISETVQGREVQLMKDDIIKRPTSGHYIKAVPSRTNGNTATSNTTSRSSVKRTSSVTHPPMDSSFKRRIINTTPSGITVSSSSRYTNVAHVQSLNINTSAMPRVKSGHPNVVPSAITTVTVQSSVPSVVLPPEPRVSSSEPKNFDGGTLNT